MFVSQIPHSFGEVPGKASCVIPQHVLQLSMPSAEHSNCEAATAGRVYDEPEQYDEWSQVSQGTDFLAKQWLVTNG